MTAGTRGAQGFRTPMTHRAVDCPFAIGDPERPAGAVPHDAREAMPVYF